MGLIFAATVLSAAQGPVNAMGLGLSAVVALAVSLVLETTISNVLAGFIRLSDGVLRLNVVIQTSEVPGTGVRLGW